MGCDSYFLNYEKYLKLPKVGVSACLSGEPVRYNGGSKQHRIITNVLTPLFEFQSICPEVGIGLPVPRPAIHLHAQLISTTNQSSPVVKKFLNRFSINAEKLIDIELRIPKENGVVSPLSVSTNKLNTYAENTLARNKQLCGYIFKSRSPSCGLGSVVVSKMSNPEQVIASDANGIFADAIHRSMPWIPVCEEQDLEVQSTLQRFYFCCCLLYDLNLTMERNKIKNSLSKFHRHHRALRNLLSTRSNRRLNSYVDAKINKEEIYALYFNYFLIAISKVEEEKFIAFLKENLSNLPEI